MIWWTKVSLSVARQLRLTIILLRSLVNIPYNIPASYTSPLLPQASNTYDELMHVVRILAVEVRAGMEPSTGSVSDNILQSDSVTVTYSWDSPGLCYSERDMILTVCVCVCVCRVSSTGRYSRPPVLMGHRARLQLCHQLWLLCQPSEVHTYIHVHPSLAG